MALSTPPWSQDPLSQAIENNSNLASTSSNTSASSNSNLSNYHWTKNNFSVGTEHDTLLGTIIDAHFAHGLNENWAFGVIGEYGPNQYRLNGTLGRQLWNDAEVKFSTDYLSQVLPFNFDSGNIDQFNAPNV